MIFANVKKLYIPEGEVKKIECGGKVLWKSGYTNQVPLSINADGSIYNGGLGYKNGYRVRSGGTEAASSGTTCTGFIPVNGRDIVRFSGSDWNAGGTGNAINAADASFANLGQVVGNNASGYGIFAVGAAYSDYGKPSIIEEATGVWKWVVPPAASGVAYIRITGSVSQTNTPPGANLIVTINEEIE